MLTKRTVFVLGAGASAVYGFPTGGQLTERVVNQLGAPNRERERLGEFFNERILDEFRVQLLESGQPSVDAFLEHRQEYLDVGKAAMGAILIGFEQPQTLYRFDGTNWMRYLFNQMRAPFEEFKKNQVALVTFNYDRSLEYFLMRALMASYGKGAEECIEVFKHIPVIHLHGRLGFLPWQGDKGIRAYHTDLRLQEIETCMRYIKVVHEDIEVGRDKDFEEAKRLLREAQRIYFLGFGYSQINLDRLDIKALDGNKAWGTAYGLTGHECAAVRAMSDSRISLYENFSCIDLLRNVVDWD